MRAEDIESLFRLYHRGVLRHANAILGDTEAAQDVMQEVFIRALNARAVFPSTATSIGWLYRTTTNLCLTGLRNSKRRKQILDRSAPRPIALGELPADTALTVQALLRDLPDDIQEIAVYYFVDEMSQDEIAALTGIPRRTVSYRLQQFRTRIQPKPTTAC